MLPVSFLTFISPFLLVGFLLGSYFFSTYWEALIDQAVPAPGFAWGAFIAGIGAASFAVSQTWGFVYTLGFFCGAWWATRILASSQQGMSEQL